MTDPTPIEIWTAGACEGPPGYGYGGWAWLAVEGGAARGVAGGERHTTPDRMKLRAAIEALKAVADAASAPLRLDLGETTLARSAAALRTGEPAEDADLWREIAALLARRTGRIVFAGGAASEERSFVLAWTDFARDICKDKGAFSAAIPKPNLTTFLAKRGSK